MGRNEARSYAMIVDQVRSSNDQKALRSLESIGAPPYSDLKTWMVKGRSAVMFAPPSASGRALPNIFGAVLTTPGYWHKDCYHLFAAFDFSVNSLFDEMMAYDAARYGGEVEVPVLIIQGEKDLQAPAALAREFFDRIKAPSKRYVELQGEGHTAVLVLGDVFLREMSDLR
jgi:pimeloyl-ACP methyl ester carboxylesterase